MNIVSVVGAQAQPRSEPGATLAEKAQDLEAAFLAEMLLAAGVGKPLESFGGGAGEEAFSSFFVREYAEDIASKGGVGLAESIVRALSGGRE